MYQNAASLKALACRPTGRLRKGRTIRTGTNVHQKVVQFQLEKNPMIWVEKLHGYLVLFPKRPNFKQPT